MSLTETLTVINDNFWYIPLVLIVCLGLYCTVRLGGIQFRNIREMCRITFSRNENRDGMSPFQVFCMSMGNRIGVGNISGPILAILVGGPGAIFWMWIFAILGSATSFLETTIGQLFKVRGSDGEFHGGPAYNIRNGLGLRRMAMGVAFVMILMYVVGFISMEVSSMASALCGAFTFDGNKLVFAVILTALTAVTILGGVRRIADMSTGIVPAMALGWFIVCVISIALSDGGVVNAFTMIFQYAFSVPSAIGGGIGAMLIIGMRRGVISNEAGIGTITNISSMADVSHPAAQGLSQSLGVFIDTIVSTLTALVILSYGDISAIVGLDLESMPLLQEVLGGAFGAAAPYLVALFLFVFAYTCLMADYVISENNLMFITGRRDARLAMCVILLIVVFVSSLFASDAMFLAVDIMLGICAVLNSVVMFRLARHAIEAWNDYRAQKTAGVKDPVFHKGCMSDPTGMTEWDE